MSAADTMCRQVNRAAPFIDAGPREGWLASELIRIGFYAIASGRGGDARAAIFADDMLAEARNRYAAGFWADPFLEPAQARPDAQGPAS